MADVGTPEVDTLRSDGFAVVYNGTEQSVDLINWDIYETNYLPAIVSQRRKKHFIGLDEDDILLVNGTLSS